jgi:uncharacterized protein YcfL
MRKIIIIILISWLFISCKSKKSYVETHSTDTIYKSSVIEIQKPQLNSLVIENICDSLSVLKPFNYTFISNNVKGTLKSVNNMLKLDVNIDSIVNSKVNEYKSSIKTEKEVIIKEVKRPFNLYSILLNVIFGLWIFKKPLIRLIKPI